MRNGIYRFSLLLALLRCEALGEGAIEAGDHPRVAREQAGGLVTAVSTGQASHPHHVRVQEQL